MGQRDRLSQEATQAHESVGPMLPRTFRVLWHPPLPRGESNFEGKLWNIRFSFILNHSDHNSAHRISYQGTVNRPC